MDMGRAHTAIVSRKVLTTSTHGPIEGYLGSFDTPTACGIRNAITCYRKTSGVQVGKCSPVFPTLWPTVIARCLLYAIQAIVARA